ncbi:MAG: FAD-dependent monooxygenase [Caulobacteraceae bacterium]|nr:FAD-dependent monooxygenase [Caulobacteraceae bacterium]
MQTEVLIVGAGPSGLALALWLARQGVAVRIVDRGAGPGRASRAFALQARTLEHYDRIGLAADAIARGQVIEAMSVHTGRGRAHRIAFGDFGKGLSPFPFVLILLQGDHEKLLIDHLAAEGVQVDWNTELVDIDVRDGGLRARLKGNGGADQTCEAAYLCGCDGAGSTVRELSKIGFPGGASEAVFYVADLRATGPLVDGELHYVTSGDDLCSVFPLKGDGRVRVIGLAPPAVRALKLQIDFEDVRPQIERDTGLEVSLAESFASYRVHQRIASAWRKGRVFLLGDASHLHSPAGGQGLNAGVGDAVNLAWKLAAVLRGRAGEALLDTYQTERVAAARQVAATTDAGFALQASPGATMGLARQAMVRLAPALMGLKPFRLWAFRALSQLGVNYRGVGASAGAAGLVAGGDRLPWVAAKDGGDNFEALRGVAWQAQVYGAAGAPLRAACARLGLPLRTFEWTPAMGRAGLARHAVYVVRPDGYVAYASIRQDVEAIGRKLARYGVRFEPVLQTSSPNPQQSPS